MSALAGAAAIKLVVLETSTLIDGYLDPTSDYSMIDWQTSQVGFVSSAPSSIDLLYNLLKIPFQCRSNFSAVVTLPPVGCAGKLYA